MKTKDLIAQLQVADPTGEEHCCIGNADIWSVNVEPAYYDGCLQVIERDQVNRPLRGHRVRSGYKVVLSPLFLHDALDYDEFVIEYLDDNDRAQYERADQEWRRQNREIDFKSEMGIFSSWVFLKIQSMKPIPLGWVERIKKAAEAFYKEHRGPDVDGKAIEDWPWQNRSYADRLEALWEEVIRVDWDNYSRITIEYKSQNGVSE
jgi:hypothetical protein